MPKQQQVVRKNTGLAEKKQQKAPSLKKTIKKAPHVEKAKIEEKTKEIKKIDATQQSSTEKELFLEKRVKDLEEELAQLKKALGTSSAPEKNGEKTAESPNAKRKREIKSSKKATKKDKKSDEATPSKEGAVKKEDEKKEVEKKDAKINSGWKAAVLGLAGKRADNGAAWSLSEITEEGKYAVVLLMQSHEHELNVQHLKEFAAKAADFEKINAKVVAITTPPKEGEQSAAQLLSEAETSFPLIIIDQENTINKALGFHSGKAFRCSGIISPEAQVKRLIRPKPQKCEGHARSVFSSLKATQSKEAKLQKLKAAANNN